MSSKNEQLILTSVKIHKDLFEKFKMETVLNKFTLQKLLNRAVDLYLEDEEFRNRIHNHLKLVTSGSI